MSAKPTDHYWFVRQNGKQYGPYSFAAIVEATKKGVIARRARIWHPSWSKWRFAGNVPGLFDEQLSEHPESIAKIMPGGELPGARSRLKLSRRLRHPPDMTVEPPPDGRFDPVLPLDPAPPRRLRRAIYALLTVAILCGAGWALIRWNIIEPGRFLSPLPPAATSPPTTEEKNMKAPPTDQPMAVVLPDAVRRLPAVLALQRNDPTAFEKFIADFAKNHTASATATETLTQARTALRKSVRFLLAKAPDEVLFEITDLSVLYMRELRTTDAESCVALSDDGKGAKLTSNLSRDFPEAFARDIKTLERIASTNVDREIRIPTEQEVQPLLTNVFAVLRSQAAQLSLFNKANLAPAEFGLYCDLVIDFYEAARKLPPNDSAKLLRYLYGAAAAAERAEPTQ